MRIATKIAVLFAVVAVMALPPGVARAQVTFESGATRGPDAVVSVDNGLVAKGQGGSATSALTTIYDNLSATAQLTVSSTDLTALWGDELFTTGTGLLSTHKFTIFNAGTSAGALLTATISVSFWDNTLTTLLGTYSGGINFGAGLLPNQFSVITASGLDPFLILLNSTDVIVIQGLSGKTGPATRCGIVVFDPVLIGASPTSMFIKAATIGGGVPGFKILGPGGNPAADPGHQVLVNEPPVSTSAKSWGTLKRLYR